MTDTFETIVGLVARSTEIPIDPAALTPHTTLESLAFDSLMLIELLFDAEEIFGIQVADIPQSVTTLGGLADLIDEVRAQSPGTA